MKIIKKIVAVILLATVILTASGCEVIRAIISLTAPPAYSARQYVEPDKATTDAIVEEIKTLCDKTGSKAEITSKRLELFTFYNKALTSRTVAQLEYYKDVTIPQNKERADKIEKYFNELHNQVLEVEKAILTSEYASIIIDTQGQSYADGILNQPIKTQELLELEGREAELEKEYSTVYSDNTLNHDTSQFAEKVADIYKELIVTRNKIASLNKKADGTPYSNYHEYAYDKIYGRNYTPEQAAGFRNAVKNNFYSIGEKLNQSRSELLPNSAYSVPINEFQIKDYMPKIIQSTSPSMSTNWKYMIQMGLYDFRYDENKYNGSFVTEFQQYGDGYMFINPTGSLISDLSTVIHEFGHYNAIFAEDAQKKGDGTIYSIDLAETHSQTFELLTLPAVKAVLENHGQSNLFKPYAANLLLQSVWSMLSNCLFDEFEYTVYTADENSLSSEFFNTTFNTAWTSYWTNRNYNYYDIPHLYSAPSYCISYSVSMMFASEIWMSENALNNYLNVVSYGTDHYIGDVATEVGLPDPLNSGNIENLALKYKTKINELLGITFDNGGLPA